jgi:hypothetical protein
MEDRMRALSLSLLLAAMTLGCGDGNLRKVNVSPAKVDAATYTNGQVQFFASWAPSRAAAMGVRILQVEWAVDNPPWLLLSVTDNVTIDANGVATCKLGYIGTNTILAIVAADPTKPIDSRGHNALIGTAQIICP